MCCRTTAVTQLCCKGQCKAIELAGKMREIFDVGGEGRRRVRRAGKAGSRSVAPEGWKLGRVLQSGDFRARRGGALPPSKRPMPRRSTHKALDSSYWTMGRAPSGGGIEGLILDQKCRRVRAEGRIPEATVLVSAKSQSSFDEADGLLEICIHQRKLLLCARVGSLNGRPRLE
jgi:hypothetical protein